MSARMLAMPLLLIATVAPAWSADSIHDAALHGQTEAVAAFLADGADPDTADEDGRNALHMAAYSGHVVVARLLLEAGADPNAPGPRGDTALHIAAEHGQPEYLHLLAEAGADLDATDPNGRTALADAVFGRQPECVRVLLEAGADPGATEGGTRGLLASAVERDEPETVRLLLDHGATHTLHTAAGAGDLDALRGLLAPDADVDALDPDYENAPHHWAAENGRPEAITLLLDAGAAVDMRNGQDVTPLHLAAFRRHLGAARALLDGGADPNAQMGHGWTMVGSHQYSYYRPLHIAAYSGHPEMVRLLLDRGADPDGRAVYGSAGGGPAGPTPLSALAPPGQTPLHVATRMAGTGYGQQFRRRFGWSWGELVQMLIDAGADVNARDGHGATPLHHAGHDEAALLIYHGADLDARDDTGSTALHWAARRGDLHMVGLLVNAGAQLSPTNNDGRTPRDLAEAADRDAVADTLRGFGAR